MHINELITLYGTVMGQEVTILKDEGCSTNVMSRSFVDKYCHLLTIKPYSVNINHSNREIIEEANEVVIDTEVQIGNTKYKSNWIVAGCRYDILLGMSANCGLQNRPPAYKPVVIYYLLHVKMNGL